MTVIKRRLRCTPLSRSFEAQIKLAWEADDAKDTTAGVW
jgi:hypothetical protein